MRLRRRRVLADGIIDILNKDLEALMLTLFESLKEIRLLQGQVEKALDKAYGLFIEAEMVIGSRKIEEVSLPAQSVDYDFVMSTRSGVLGIVVPTFNFKKGNTEGMTKGEADGRAAGEAAERTAFIEKTNGVSTALVTLLQELDQ